MPITSAYDNHILRPSTEPGDERLRAVAAAADAAALELLLRMVLVLDCNYGLDLTPFLGSYTLYQVHLSTAWQAE